MKNCYTTITFILILCFVIFSQSEGNDKNMYRKEDVREPAVSGSFYPGGSKELSETVDELLKSASKHKIDGRLSALIAPHAGYKYSGPIAAESFKQVEGMDFETVVIVGASHRVRFEGISTYPRGYYKTPLGKVQIDEKLSKQIRNLFGYNTQEISSSEKEKEGNFSGTFRLNPQVGSAAPSGFYPPAHTIEHSVEVEIPFIQKVLPEAKIVPIIIGSHSADTIQKLSTVFTKIMKNPKYLLVISTDLSHYHSYSEAKKLDNSGLESIEKLDSEGLLEKLKNGETEFCNSIGALSVVISAKSIGANAKLLMYKNSGDVTGDKSDGVVGYGAVAFSLEENSPKKIELKFSDSEKREMLNIARKSIKKYIDKNEQIDIKPSNDKLTKKCGAFVTLKINGNLRGCIGYIDAIMPLYQTISQAAVAAATQDPRFKPVNKEELEEIEIEISVLSPLKPVDNIEEIEVGKHGLYMRKEMSSGLLLPQVPTEQGWNRKQFLEGTCRKAGLPLDAWRSSGLDIYIFTAEVFNEKEINTHE